MHKIHKEIWTILPDSSGVLTAFQGLVSCCAVCLTHYHEIQKSLEKIIINQLEVLEHALP